MSVVLLTGSHPRHRHLAAQLHAAGLLKALVIEQREAFVPAAPAGLAADLAGLFERHFRERDEAEARHFGAAGDIPDTVPQLQVDREGLNGPAVQDFLRAQPARLLLSYGVHMLSPETLDAAEVHYRWNIHGGLSPWYRGCITHFWPSYFLEPQMTGFTVHELTQVLDHGPVIHQTGTRLVRGDGLHDLAGRAGHELVEALPRLIDIACKRDDIQGISHNTSGRLWLARDWRPEHLRVIYQHHDNRIVDLCLDGAIEGREPELITQW